MLSHTIIAAADINGQKKIFGRFRGKVAREIYRCGKGVLVTRSIAKPFFYAVSKIPNELSKGFVYSVAGQIGETTLGYISGIGFIRYIYKVSSPEKLKATARIIYNVGALPMTIYSKGIGATFDTIGLSKIEEAWFGTPVYIFDDNRLWIESNFTVSDVFDSISD